MPIDIAAIATTVVTSFLIPYVKKGAEKIAEEVTNTVSKGAAEHAVGLAQKVWNKVKSLFSSDKEKNTLQYFEQDPDTFQAAVEKILQQKLEQDSQAAQELDALLNAPEPTGGSTGAQIMNATYAGIADLRGANFSGAHGMNISGVSIGSQPPPIPSDRPDTEKKS
jgi:hypothetical protein